MSLISVINEAFRFIKPLNPILGETACGSYPDGTMLYAEQISHHPNITYMLVINENYRMSYAYQYVPQISFNKVMLI